jgi:filamentous hemagglutinin
MVYVTGYRGISDVATRGTVCLINTHVSGANSVTMLSGGDTNVIGSNVTGRTVIADVGGNLNIRSVQDTTVSSAHQSSAGGGISVSTTGGSASFNSSKGNANGDYAGVNEQAGIRAGDGGFHVNVKNNADLTGAVIASTADPSKNSLTTGTLTTHDIENHSTYNADSSGLSAGAGIGNTGKSIGPGAVSGSGGITPMISQSDSCSAQALPRAVCHSATCGRRYNRRRAQRRPLASQARCRWQADWKQPLPRLHATGSRPTTRP